MAASAWQHNLLGRNYRCSLLTGPSGMTTIAPRICRPSWTPGHPHKTPVGMAHRQGAVAPPGLLCGCWL